MVAGGRMPQFADQGSHLKKRKQFKQKQRIGPLRLLQRGFRRGRVLNQAEGASLASISWHGADDAQDRVQQFRELNDPSVRALEQQGLLQHSPSRLRSKQCHRSGQPP